MKKIYLILVICLLIPVVNARWEAETADLQLTTSYQPSPAEPGNYVRLYFYIYNAGVETKSDVWFKLEADYPFSIEENIKYYGEIVPFQRITLEYDVWVDSDAPEEDYTDKLRLLQCYDSACSSGPYEEIAVSVRRLYPILEISNIELDDEIIPGDKTQVKVVLDNKGGSRIKDVKLQLNLSSSSMPIAPYRSSTEKRVSNIGKDEKVVVIFDLVVDGDADSDLYKIPIDISYYDNSNNFYSMQDIIGLIIGSKPEIMVGLEEYDYLTSGSMGDVTFNIINRGSSDAKFLSITVLPSDDFEILSPSEIYIGNLDPDDYETAQFKIKLNKIKGDFINIPIRLSYADINNEKYVDTGEVPLKIYSSAEVKQLTGADSYTVWVLLVIIVIAGILYYRYRKKKKQKV